MFTTGGAPPSPNYGIALYSSGAVEFCGVTNVEALGSRQTQVPSERVEEIVRRAKSEGFFSFANEFISPVTDASSAELSIAESPGKLKSVFSIGGEMVGMPTVVSELVAEVVKIADENHWTGVTSAIPDFPECGPKFGFGPPIPMPPPPH